MDKRKKLEIVLASLTFVFAFFAWLSVRSAVIVPDSSTWIVPMIFFSVFVLLICLDIMLFREVLGLELVLIGSLLLSLFFAFSWLQLCTVLIGGYLLFLSSRKTRRDMELNVKISPWKSLQAGKTYLILSLSLLIAMQYFLIIRSFDGEKKVPHFDASFITKKIAIPFISSVNPQFKALRDETLTVDQFILQSQSSQQENSLSAEDEQSIDDQLPENLTPAQKEMIKTQFAENFSNAKSQIAQKNKELVLAIGRKQLSDVVGEPVGGDERISEVFTGLINNKINDYFNPKIGTTEKNSVFSVILAVVLFLIIYPMGVILSMVWFLLVGLAISVLLKFQILSVKSIQVSKEVLE